MNFVTTAAAALLIGLVGGFLTFRNVKRQGGEENPMVIGIGSGIIAGILFLIVRYVFW